MDGKWIALGSLEPKFWMGFCQLVGKVDWMNKIFNATLKPEVDELFLTKTRDEWVEFAKDSDICLTAILEMDELESDDYLQKRNMFVEHEHPTYGKYKGINQPIKFGNTPSSSGWAPPLMGEDNVDILKSLGYSAEEIQALSDSKVIVKGDS